MGELFLNRKDFFLNCFFKWAKLAKFIRFEAGWKLMWDEVRDASISITKFTEMEWNDGVFEGSKEHRRCSGKCTVFYLFLWILIILYAKIFLSYLCFQGSKVGEIHSLWSDVEIVYFLSQSSPSIGEMMSFLRTLRNIGDVLETFYNLRFLRNDKVASIGSAIN